jgi:8-oxo-dGTP pyrophosphatase MutT (NUDIX family)
VLPRKQVHLYNILHRGIGVLVYRARQEQQEGGAQEEQEQQQEEIFVHQRSHTKRVFPSMYDMFVGGVSGAGEDSDTSASRELAEELNIHTSAPLPPPTPLPPLLHEAVVQEAGRLRFLFDCIVATRLNRCRVRVYDVRVAADAAAGIAFQESEVAGGRFEARAAVDAAAEESWRRDILQQQQRQPAAVGDDGHDDEEEEPRIFVPDGLAVWNAYLEWERERKGC